MVLVSIGTCGSREMRSRPRRFDTLVVMKGETVVIHNILNNQINCSRLDQLEAPLKLFQQVGIMTVDCAKEKHHHLDFWDGNLATRKLHDQSDKTRAILEDWLGVVLDIIEAG